MRAVTFALLGAVAAAVGVSSVPAAAAPRCLPIAGAETLWSPATRWVIVGEMHGTTETPQIFAELVCLAGATRRPVTVALEWSRDSQPALDAYLASDGGATARAALMKLPIWHADFQDGRSSVAFLAMIERLRALHRVGLVVHVVGVDVGAASPKDVPRDTIIAQGWRDIPMPENGIVVALVGNVHAMRLPLRRGERTIVTAASLLPRDRTITLDTTGRGGTAWACMADGCGVQRLGGEPNRFAPAVELTRDAADPWDGTLWLGRSTTASLPADPARRTPAKATMTIAP